MAGTGLQPTGRIFAMDPAPHLESAGVSRQGLASRGIVARAELDHVPTFQRILLVQVGVITSRPVALEICLQARNVIA